MLTQASQLEMCKIEFQIGARLFKTTLCKISANVQCMLSVADLSIHWIIESVALNNFLE